MCRAISFPHIITVLKVSLDILLFCFQCHYICSAFYTYLPFYTFPDNFRWHHSICFQISSTFINQIHQLSSIACMLVPVKLQDFFFSTLLPYYSNHHFLSHLWTNANKVISNFFFCLRLKNFLY